MSMSLSETKDELVWMMQHVGASLWSIGADNRIHAWNLTQVVADKGIFPFNIRFVCMHKETKEEVVFMMRDIDECLFRTQKDASGQIHESEAPAV